MAEQAFLPHKLTLNERKDLSVSGVTEVISFDDSTVILTTPLGTLSVHGTALQLKTLSLDGGQVAVEGQISALMYEDSRPVGGFFKRMFGA